MSIVQKETIEVIAQSIGINNLSPDVALALAPDVEYRVREIMQVKNTNFSTLHLYFISVLDYIYSSFVLLGILVYCQIFFLECL